MTTPRHEQPSGWRRVAGACGALLIAAACSPAGTSAPAPVPTATSPAPTPAGAPVETVIAAASASPAAPTVPAPAAAGPVVVRPSASSPASPAAPPSPPPGSPPVPVPLTPVRAGLPAGPGRDTVQQVCTGCHAIGMVTANGRTSDDWAEMIERMMGLGMEASDEDLQAVHAYLTREFPPRRAN